VLRLRRMLPPTVRLLVLVAAGALLGACHPLGAGPVRSASTVGTGAPARLTVDFIDVGHGDAILVTSPAGKRVLVDGGRGESGAAVAAFIRARSVAPLDLVVLTHRHADHLGGLAAVIAAPGARLFLDAATPEGTRAHASPAYTRLIALLAEHGIPVREARRGRSVDLGGGAVLVLLTPPEPPIAGSRSDVNANSVVARLELGQVRMLLTGDAEAVTEDWLLDSGADVRADVLKLAHHGSAYSSSPRFLAAVHARLAVASCGPVGHVGQLDPGTAARVERTGARLYRTDLDGTIEVSTDGRDLRVETERPR